ncbi:MAG: MopE-related protein [Myxococcota bacterium]|nr:MopE-related protein [Myxococcota bacterium]
MREPLDGAVRDASVVDASGDDGGVDGGDCVPAPETCDGRDEDCDGAVDEALTRGCGSDVGACAPGTETCAAGVWGACEGGVGPGAEACDGATDEDCDGATDEGCPCVEGESRACGSDVGACRPGTQTCAGGALGPCVGAVEPAAEACDGITDEDCDGLVDEGVQITVYRDADGDGHGDASMVTADCGASPGWALVGDDCDDDCAGCHPGAAEACDTRDQDCDGRVDEGARTTFYRDRDGDGHGDPGVTVEACTAPAGHVASAGDCDDDCASCRPGGTETCDARDQDCDGTLDEAPSGGAEPCPCPRRTFGGHSYLFCRGAYDHTMATARCASVGYALTAIESAAEQSFVWGEISRGAPDDWWIGLEDRASEGVYVWPDGSPLGGYSNWNADQPDNGGLAPVEEDCVEIAAAAGGRWNDLGCGVGYLSLVCESP